MQHRPQSSQRPAVGASADRQSSRDAVHAFERRPWSVPILRADGALLLVTGLAALVADLVGYSFGVGPFAALVDQPFAVGAVEAHGLAALIGWLVLRSPPAERWRWHAVALVVHLFLGTANLTFWNVYAAMDLISVGWLSTVAHAALVGLQLACLALATAPDPLPVWLRRLRRNGLYVRQVAVATLLLGATAHLVVIGLGREVLPLILTPSVELLLTVPMFYVSIAGWLAWRNLRFRGRWHRIVLVLILIYFPLGLPFHMLTITTGSTAHYAALPAWYSLLILPMMVAMILVFASLRLAAPRSHERDA